MPVTLAHPCLHLLRNAHFSGFLKRSGPPGQRGEPVDDSVDIPVHRQWIRLWIRRGLPVRSRWTAYGHVEKPAARCRL